MQDELQGKSCLNYIKKLIYPFLAIITMMIYVVPLFPSMPNGDLDPSWAWTIDEGISKGLVFGQDLIFTYGPFGNLRLPHVIFYPHNYYSGVILALVLSTVIGVVLTFLCEDFSQFEKCTILAFLYISLVCGGSILFFFVQALYPCLVFGYKDKPLNKILLYLVVGMMALSCLIKFSHFPSAFILVVMADLYLYTKEKKYGYNTLLFGVSFILLFLIAGQPLNSLKDFMVGSFHISSGYTEAMSMDGNIRELMIFLLMTLGVYFLPFKKVLQERKQEDLYLVLSSLVVLFILFKAGFTRHDAHSLKALGGLSVLAVLLLSQLGLGGMNLGRIKVHKALYLVVCVLVLISLCIRHSQLNKGHGFNVIVSGYLKGACGLVNVFSGKRFSQLEKEYELAVRAVKDSVELPDIDGSVDIYPWDQSWLIANKAPYQFRPVTQSYSVYDDYLIRKNKEFLYSSAAADSLLFTVKTIDHRHPGMMEGSMWLDIMKLYDVVDRTNDLLLLKRTTKEKSYSLTEVINKKISFGEIVNIPVDMRGIYLKIKIEKSFFGELTNILYKCPVIYMNYTTKSGRHLTHRIIPKISSSGFIISPEISDVGDFYAFSVGSQHHDEVVSFSLMTKEPSGYTDVNIRLYQITTRGFDINNTSKLLKGDLRKRSEYMIQENLNNRDPR